MSLTLLAVLAMSIPGQRATNVTIAVQEPVVAQKRSITHNGHCGDDHFSLVLGNGSVRATSDKKGGDYNVDLTATSFGSDFKSPDVAGEFAMFCKGNGSIAYRFTGIRLAPGDVVTRMSAFVTLGASGKVEAYEPLAPNPNASLYHLLEMRKRNR